MSNGAILRFGKVVNVDDPHGGGRIQVRTEYDNTIEKDEHLEYCIPLLPKMLHVIPKVGELVLVVSMSAGDYENMNFYVGPIISQEDKLYFEDKDKALAITSEGWHGWDPNPRYNRNTLPTLYPDLEDISLEGRKSAGLQLKDNEVRVKAGVKVMGVKGPESNTEDPAFMSLKYYPDNRPKDGFKSTATIVADKINLISTKSDDPATRDIPVTQNKDADAKEKDNLISDNAMRELVEKAHKLPYGDTLIEFLDLLRTAFAKHVHPFPTMAPCTDENMKAVATYDLDGMLSDNIRIN